MSAHPVSYDALVIGGGPAGATAALSMVRAGLAVRLAEPAAPPETSEPVSLPSAG